MDKERNKVLIELLRKQLESKRLLTTEFLSYFDSNIPISIGDMRKKSDSINWSAISSGAQFEWSIEILSEFIDNWDWKELSRNHKLPWSEKLVEQFENYWDWNLISKNLQLPWSEAFLLKYWKRFNQMGLFDNPKIQWDLGFILDYFGEKDWSIVNSLPLSFIRKFLDQKRTENHSLIDKIDKNILIKNDVTNDYEDPDKKPIIDLELTLDEYEKFYKEKDWSWWYGSSLAWRKDAPWTLKLIDKYKKELLLDGPFPGNNFCQNTGLFWTEEILDKFKNILNWQCLSLNPSLPWSLSLLKKFSDKLHWGQVLKLINKPLENDRHKVLISLFRDDMDWDVLFEIKKSILSVGSLWSWVEDVEINNVKLSLRHKEGPRWKRSAVRKKLHYFMEFNFEKTEDVIRDWFEPWINKDMLVLCGAVYGPARLTPKLFIKFLSQLYLLGEKRMKSLLEGDSYKVLKNFIPKRPQYLFSCHLNSNSFLDHQRVQGIITSMILDIKDLDFGSLYPYHWMGFEKKEYKPPIWDLVPGRSVGPFYLGIPLDEVHYITGEAYRNDPQDEGHLYFYHGHLQFDFDENLRVSKITVDRQGNWKYLYSGENINDILHFRLRYKNRFPFDELYDDSEDGFNTLQFLRNGINKYIPNESFSDYFLRDTCRRREEDDHYFKYEDDRYIRRKYQNGVTLTWSDTYYTGYPITKIEVE